MQIPFSAVIRACFENLRLDESHFFVCKRNGEDWIESAALIDDIAVGCITLLPDFPCVATTDEAIAPTANAFAMLSRFSSSRSRTESRYANVRLEWALNCKSER
jgi:hypothetical protein